MPRRPTLVLAVAHRADAAFLVRAVAAGLDAGRRVETRADVVREATRVLRERGADGGWWRRNARRIDAELRARELVGTLYPELRT